MTMRWCCRLLQEEFGPMDLEELRKLVKSGTLSRSDVVRRETEDVWTVASKCPELRDAFEPLGNSQKTRHARTFQPVPTPEAIRLDAPAQPSSVSGTNITAPEVAPPSPRQLWTIWCVTAGLMLLLLFVNWLIASATPTFPQPRRIREQLAAGHWFLGTGPWSQWESVVLWLDSLIVSWFVGRSIALRQERTD